MFGDVPVYMQAIRSDEQEKHSALRKQGYTNLLLALGRGLLGAQICFLLLLLLAQLVFVALAGQLVLVLSPLQARKKKERRRL